jgi:hypothetical protein
MVRLAVGCRLQTHDNTQFMIGRQRVAVNSADRSKSPVAPATTMIGSSGPIVATLGHSCGVAPLRGERRREQVPTLDEDRTMRRRHFMTTTGAIALAAPAMAAQLALGRDEDGKESTKSGKADAGNDRSSAEHSAFKSCAKECSDCQRACDECSTHCAQLLAKGGEHHQETLATCQDCADVCAAASQIVSRSGPFAADICRACAAVCAQCAEACERHAHDETMAACAKSCRSCEDACRRMLSATAARTLPRR